MLFFLNFSGILMFTALSIIFLKYFSINNKAMEHNNTGIAILMLSGLVLRILIAPFIRGYGADMSCFTGWSEGVFVHGFSNFYTSIGFSDYPPGYLYILYILGGIRRIFSIETNQVAYNILLKLPSMIADVICGLVIYKFAMKNISKSMGLLLAAMFIFNPMIYLNSSWWGQVDSVFTLLIMLALIGLYEKKHIYSAVMFSLALLVKPQAVIVFPVYIFYIIRLIKDEKFSGIKSAVLSALAGAVVFFLLVIPFSPSGNPLWVFDLYMKTLSSYPYASLNTPNFFGLLGANGTNIYKPFLFLDYNIWSNIFIVGICALSAIIYFKNKDNKGIFSVSALLITGMYIMAAKMHERYIFPAIALFILYYIVSQKRFSLLFGALFSFVAYVATAWVLTLDVSGANPWIAANSPAFIFLSLIGVLSFAFMLVWLVKNKKPVPVSNLKQIKKTEGKSMAQPIEEPKQNEKYTKRELMFVLGLTVVYAFIAFFNLGDMIAPETAWENKAGDVAIIDTGKVQDIAVFNFFNGRLPTATQDNNNKPAPQYRLEVSRDGKNYEFAVDFAAPSVFKWESHKINKTARFLRLSAIASKDKGFLNEVAIFDHSEKLITIESITDSSGNTIQALFDEQTKTVYRQSFRNSTYFDEIYHARTAYEHIHGIEAYEWTHPPLGKLIIAMGVKTFGMTPFGWRFMGTLFGVLMLPIMYAFARRIFKNAKFAFLATFLLCFDFMHFTQTRIATIDTYATFFILIMYYFMYRFYETNYNHESVKKPLKYLLYAGIFFGIGAASKWTCIYAGAGLAVIFCESMIKRLTEYNQALLPEYKNDNEAQRIVQGYKKKTLTIILWCIVYFVIIPVCIYALSYLPYAFIKGNSYALADIWRIQENMFKYHSGLKAEHSFSSVWYKWPIMARPMWYYVSTIPEKNLVSSISAFGNPAVWWTSIIASFAMAYMVIKKFVNQNFRLQGKNYYAIMVAVFIGVGYLAQYLPWVGVKRVVFIYHYFTSVPFIILIITYVAWQIYNGLKTEKEKKIYRNYIYTYMGIVVLLFIMFYPVLSGFEVQKGYITHYLTWFNTWIFGG